MSDIAILVVEDEPEVRDAVSRDLTPFAGHFRIEMAEDVTDARAVLEELEADRVSVGLILCDHLLPGTHGTDFLIQLHGEERTRDTRKVLLTGQAGLDDTVRAINQAGLDYYVAKPWTPDELHEVIRHQLTEYVLGGDFDLLQYVVVLDGPRLVEAAADRGWEGRST